MRKFEILADSIRRKIASLPNGSKLPSVRSLMKRYSYSLQTVNCALELLSSEGLIDVRHGSGCYVSSSQTIRCIEFHRPDYPSRWLEAKELALCHAVNAAGWKIVIRRHDCRLDDLSNYPNTNASAHIVAAGLIDLRWPFFNNLLQLSVPVIAFGREAGSFNLDYITGNDHQMFSLLVKHLKELGHHRIAMLVNEPDCFEIRQRRQIFAEILELFDMAPAQYIECRTQDGENSSVMARRGLFEFLDRSGSKKLPFTALIVASAAGVIGALRALSERRIQVPRDCSLASFGCEIENSLFVPSVTDAGYLETAWGENTIVLLKQRFESNPPIPIAIKIPAALNIRESTATPHK